MSNRARGSGLTASLRRENAEKYNHDDEEDALIWIEAVINEEDLFIDVEGEKQTHEALKDGVYLCELMSNLEPGLINTINKPTSPFKCMENINMFLSACRQYGVKSVDLFETGDLYEGINMRIVIHTIHALGRKARANGYDGPCLGPRESTENPRVFTEQQLRSRDKHIGLQMGSNKGANQSGLNFGKLRSIVD